jgi:hypothetical protein
MQPHMRPGRVPLNKDPRHIAPRIQSIPSMRARILASTGRGSLGAVTESYRTHIPGWTLTTETRVRSSVVAVDAQ